MLDYLLWMAAILYVLSYLAFYFRMRKVGRMLGGDFTARMNVALTLAIIIPTDQVILALRGVSS